MQVFLVAEGDSDLNTLAIVEMSILPRTGDRVDVRITVGFDAPEINGTRLTYARFEIIGFAVFEAFNSEKTAEWVTPWTAEKDAYVTLKVRADDENATLYIQHLQELREQEE